MSRTLTVYAVPLDRLRRVVGSRDEALIAAVTRESAGFFGRIDELADPDPDEAPAPTCAGALARVVRGDDLEDVPGHHGYVYGYVLEALCGHLGEELEGVDAIVGASDWSEEVDRFLAEVEVPLTLADLIFGPHPVRLPEPDDVPMIGHWSPERLTRALGPLRGVRLDGSDRDEDAEVAEIVGQIREWVEAAVARPGTALVGVLS